MRVDTLSRQSPGRLAQEVTPESSKRNRPTLLDLWAWPWTSYLRPQCLGFPGYKTGTAYPHSPITRIKNAHKVLSQGLAQSKHNNL